MEIAFDTTESKIEKQQLKFTLEAEKRLQNVLVYFHDIIYQYIL